MYKHMTDTLDQQIKAVCPIDGVSFGKEDKKETWSIQFSPEATMEQKKAAIEVLDNFRWDDKKDMECDETARISDLKTQLPMKAGYILYTDSHPKASFEDYIAYLDGIVIQ